MTSTCKKLASGLRSDVFLLNGANRESERFWDQKVGVDVSWIITRVDPNDPGPDLLL